MSDQEESDTKSKFTADEKKTLIALAWIAGTAVSDCDQAGGTREQAKEHQARRTGVAGSFLAYQVKTGEGMSGEPEGFDADKAESLLPDACAKAIAVHEGKDAANLDLYKKVVLEVAYGVAMAYGAGWRGKGPKVSDKELQMVNKIAETVKATHLLAEVKKDVDEHAPKDRFGG